jgi:hypothetical protein
MNQPNQTRSYQASAPSYLELDGSLTLTFDPSGTVTGNLDISQDPGGMEMTTIEVVASVVGTPVVSEYGHSFTLNATGTHISAGGAVAQPYSEVVTVTFQSDYSAGTATDIGGMGPITLTLTP